MADLDSGTPNTHCTRPSFYAAIRLARLILFVRERFKSRIRSRRLSVESRAVCGRGFSRTDAVDEISRALNVRSRSETFLRPRCSSKNIHGGKLELSTLLHNLDANTKPWGDSVSEFAADDQQFLQYDAQRVTITKNSALLSHILELTTLVLHRLQAIQASSGNPSRKDDQISNSDCSLLSRERFVANLEHILRCLQQAVVEALIRNHWRLIETDILHWHQYWQQRRQSREGWFAEWPNGQRPLNTTWPWNVKPSLVILWGVCWMFYDDYDYDRNNSQMTRRLGRPDRQDEVPLSENMNIMWTRQLSQALPDQDPIVHSNTNQAHAHAQAQAQHNGAWIADSNINTFQHASWLPGGDRVNAEDESHALSRDLSHPESDPIYLLPDEYTAINSTIPYIYSISSVTSESFPAPTSPWPCNLSNRNTDTSYPLFNELQPAYRQQQPQQQTQPQNLVNLTQMIEREVRAEPHVPRLPRHKTSRPHLEVPVIQMTDYPSPRSVISAPRMSPSSSGLPFSPSLEANPPSSTIESPQSRRESSVRSTESTRNDQGLLRCKHPDCANGSPEFSRTCEYKKHKDKHDRPYICKVPGCEKIQGFTYSGGLLRHEREVHGQHGGPKASCMCPHLDCKRSIGKGFSRKENLHEHLRRVHRGVGDEKETLSTVMTTMAPSSSSQQVGGGEQGRKRRRFDDGGDDDDDVDDASGSRDLQLQVKRLRRELREKDERLKALELKVERLAR